MLKPSDRFYELRKLYKKQLIPKDQYEKEIPYVYEEAMERNVILQKITPYYDIDNILETVYGRFSNVLNYQSKDGQILSLRIMKKKDEGLFESEWQKMKHNNIVTILNRQIFDEVDAVCYLSLYEQYNLKQVITSDVFKTSKQSSMFLPKWLNDITSGLEYIHSKMFAHTNITANNIIIQHTLVASITDFHFLNTSMKASNRIGIKSSHRPPESFRNGDGTSFVDCRKVDVWSLGILAINIFTGLYLEKKLPDNVTCWSQDVYSQIFKVLKKRKFNKLHGIYLKYPSGNDILKSARSFAAFCLQFDPIKRPPVKDLMEHNLMNKSDFLPKKDNMWHKKVHWKKIEKEISLLNEDLGLTEDLDFVLEVEPSPYLENVNNSNDMENTISLAKKSKLEFESQNHNNQKNSDVKQEIISRFIDKKEIPSNCLPGDAEKNMIILDDDTQDDLTYGKEIIQEPLQEDEYTGIKSEADRLADLLLSITELQQPNKNVENTEIVKNMLILDDDTTHEEERIKEPLQEDNNTDIKSEGDRLADLLLSITEFHQPNKNVENTEIVKHMLILDDDTTHEEERIKEPLQEDNNTDIKSEGDRLADLLLSITEFQIPNPNVENTEILKSEENIRTSIEIDDKKDADYFSIASKTEKYSEDDQLADLLISLSEFKVHSTNDEEENIVLVDEKHTNQKENIIAVNSTTELQKEIKTNSEIQDIMKDNITEENTMYSSQMHLYKPEEETKNNISPMDFQKEKNAEKCSSYWNNEVGVYLLNLFIDNNSSNGMLHPENYLFKLVQKL